LLLSDFEKKPRGSDRSVCSQWTAITYTAQYQKPVRWMKKRQKWAVVAEAEPLHALKHSAHNSLLAMMQD